MVNLIYTILLGVSNITQRRFYPQIICHIRKMILQLSPGYPGCSGDAYVYNVSPLRNLAEEGVLGDYYLLSDSV